MIPATQDLEAFTAGDHWKALAPGMSIQVAGFPPALPLTKVRLRFKPKGLPANDPRNSDRVELTSEGDSPEIIIDNAAAWTFHAPSQPVPALLAGEWDFNIELTDSAGTVETYVRGVQPVLSDV